MPDRYYKPPKNPVPGGQEHDRINDLTTEYVDSGWLSTLVWNTRNAYLTWPDSTFSADQMRMIVEGFLAEIQALKPSISGDGGEVIYVANGPEVDG